MRTQLPEVAVQFAEAASRRLHALGGVQLARHAQAEPSVRSRVAQALDGLGVDDIDVRADLDTMLVGAELCRVAGAVVLPYPVVGTMTRQTRASLALVDPRAPRIDHGDLGDWVAADLDGRAWRAEVAAPATGSRLGPFVVRMTLREPAALIDPRDVSLHVTLGCWQLLGALQTALLLTIEHVTTREQFGRPLAEFQAVRFQVVDATVAVQGLQELAKYTAWRLFTAPAEAYRADALALRLHALDVAHTVLRVAHQLHGAIGFCDEHDLSVLSRHVQPLLRMPESGEQLVERLVPAVAAEEFETLFAAPPSST